jgi:transposase
MSTPEVDAEIIRLYYAEHWKIGTISAQLALHPDTVRRVLGLASVGSTIPLVSVSRARMVDPYRHFIQETLSRYPKLCSTRLHDMIKDRGYRGAPRTLREYVATVRPRPRREVFLHTETLPGEQAQADWAYVGKISVPGGERALWLFVLVLSHSRALWAEFVLDLTVHSLCRSLVRSAVALGGVPRQWLFDNPKIVVLERQGDAIRFHPVLLELCGKMRVQARLCAVARPQHKGKVERSIRYLRDRFLAGRTILSITDGNTQLNQFLTQTASLRPHPVKAPLTVSDVLKMERERLLLIPTPLPMTDFVHGMPVDRQAFIRFDTNRYSVPPQYAGRTLTLVVDDLQLRVLDGGVPIVHHERNYGKRQIIEDPDHRAAILRQRRAAQDLKGRDRLSAAAPQFNSLLNRWAEAGYSLATQIAKSVQLLDLYGEEIFRLAVEEMNVRHLQDIGALMIGCDRLRRERHRPLPLDIPLPSHVDDCDVIPHDLGNYDEN